MNAIDKQYHLEPNRRISQIITGLILIILLCWSISAIQFDQLATNGLTIAKNILLGLVQPDVELLFNFTNGLPYLLIETIAIAFLGDRKSVV